MSELDPLMERLRVYFEVAYGDEVLIPTELVVQAYNRIEHLEKELAEQNRLANQSEEE